MRLFMHSKNIGRSNLPGSTIGAGYKLAKKKKERKRERNKRKRDMFPYIMELSI